MVIERGSVGDGGRALSGGMGALVAKMGIGGDLLMFGEVELAVLGHFGHSDKGR